MTHGFAEIAIGDVVVAPFVGYAGVTLTLFLLLRPILRWIGFDLLFSNPPLANACLYTIILAALIVLF